MSKTILYIGMSLDGYIAGPDDDISWMERYNNVDYGFDKFMERIGLVILGRRAYEVGIEHGWGWPYPRPGIILSEHKPAETPEGADLTFEKGDVKDILVQAKQRTDKDIWVGGGANMAQAFLKEGLVDELALAIIPTILGGGISLFGDLGKRIELERQSVETYDEGLVFVTYKVLK